MALSIGELTAYLRADDSGMQRGLAGARLALRGLQRDADGRLRDMQGRFVSEGEAMGRGLRHGLMGAAGAVVGAFGRIGAAVGGVGVGIPVIAATATALMGVASGAVAAGIAVGAFGAAVGPQMTAVAEVADLAEKAEEAAAEGGEKAAAAQKKFKDALAELPAPTRETAKAFLALKKEHKEWSAQLAPKTMPVLTKGINLLRKLLPMLTPFVETAARVFGNFLEEIGQGLKSAGFKQWASDMQAAAGPALTNFLAVIKNLAIGFGALIQAFLPQSDSMTGGIVRMSEAFAKWATSLQGSEGFAQFLTLAREGGGVISQLALAAVKLLIALGPLIGITTQIALAMARFINSLPPGVVQALAFAITGAVVALKLWAVYSRVAAAASTLFGASASRTAGRWVMAAARSVGAFVRIAVAATVNAARTAAVWAASAARMAATWLVQIVRVAARTVAAFVMMAARAVAWAAIMAAQWLIAMGPVGWIIAAVVALIAVIVLIATKTQFFQTIWAAVWGWLKAATAAAVSGILAAISWLGRLPSMVGGWIMRMAALAIARFLTLVAWVRGLPGRIYNALKSLAAKLLATAIIASARFRGAIISKFTSIVSWVRGIPGRIKSALGNLASLLVSKGRDVVRGLWNGIKSMGGWLKSTLIGWAKSIIPGPIAKALHIGSPSKLMAQQVGRWIPAGIVSGIQSGQGQLDSTMANLVDPGGVGVGGGARMGAGAAAGGGGAQTVNLRIEVAGPDDVKRLIRKIVRVDGRGSVQTAFG